jgi:transcriptional regulator with XRE-family HTH domain
VRGDPDVPDADHVERPASKLIRAVGGRVRALRLERHLTLDELSQRSGVSRRMITMLEAGETNASLGTLDKLAHALGCAFADLVVGRPVAPLVPERAEAQQPVWEDGRGSSARLLVARSMVATTELWLWQLSPGGRYEAEADPAGSEEILLVGAGRLVVEVGTDELDLVAGQYLRLPSDAPYAYRNPARTTNQFLRVILAS